MQCVGSAADATDAVEGALGEHQLVCAESAADAAVALQKAPKLIDAVHAPACNSLRVLGHVSHSRTHGPTHTASYKLVRELHQSA